LSTTERGEISRGLAAGESLRSISARLGRCVSTISREVTRNGGRAQYRAGNADARAWHEATRPNQCLLAHRRDLLDLVAHKLAEDWSPDQINGWLNQQYPRDHTMRVSHEKIYLILFLQTPGVLKKGLKKHLRSRRTTMQAHGTSRKGQGLVSILDRVSIRERPAHAQHRSIPGPWEGDLLPGSYNTHVIPLVERYSRFIQLIKVYLKTLSHRDRRPSCGISTTA
jgi:Transposase and inactivated derivatives, IS30 family